jgi:hypothetical protein
MGLLDGLIGNVLGSVSSGNQGQDPLGSVLGRLGSGNQHGAEICCFSSLFRCYSKMAGWRESLASFVRVDFLTKRTPG